MTKPERGNDDPAPGEMPEDFEPWMAEGMHTAHYCPRGRTDCTALAQIIAENHGSFCCAGELAEIPKDLPQDKYRYCFKNHGVDELSDFDKRDLVHDAAVKMQALAIIEQRDSAAYHKPPAPQIGETGNE